MTVGDVLLLAFGYGVTLFAAFALGYSCAVQRSVRRWKERTDAQA